MSVIVGKVGVPQLHSLINLSSGKKGKTLWLSTKAR